MNIKHWADIQRNEDPNTSQNSSNNVQEIRPKHGKATRSTLTEQKPLTAFASRPRILNLKALNTGSKNRFPRLYILLMAGAR